MKKLLPILMLFLYGTTQSYGQVGYIHTFSQFPACNISVNNAGLLYTADGNVVRRIDSGLSNNTVVVAGGGNVYGDGGQATGAQLTNCADLAFDAAGNMYIADDGAGVVRKVNNAGIISTVAGNNTLGPGYTGDGGQATSARIRCQSVCTDPFGNLYIADRISGVIRKVNTSGIITTIAGTGTPGYSGDGGPATAAQIQYSPNNSEVWGMTCDAAGNLYLTDRVTFRVRRIGTNGIITTVAGNGSSGSSGVGGPATTANIYFPQGLATDQVGNLYIAQWQNCVLTHVDPAGVLHTTAGNYTISFSGDGGPAVGAGLNAVSDVALDPYGNIYIADCHNNRIRKVTGSYLSGNYVANNFGVFINMLCSGPALNISTQTYNPAYTIMCNYGDGTTNTAQVTQGLFNGGNASMTHAYNTPGTYTIKTTLLNGGVPIDSISYSYEFKLCNTLTTEYYYDANGNCVFDLGEHANTHPVLTEIDSNGVAIDTLSTTGGIYYTAYGQPGDVYSFKVISSPPGMHTSCPLSGIVYDTLSVVYYNTTLNSVGFECNTMSNYDLQINPIIPVTGVNDQWGNIYVSNAHCVPENAVVTLKYDRHYKAALNWTHPQATSVTDSTITWNVSALSGTDANPVKLWYAVWRHPDSAIVVGLPVQSTFTISPTTNDANTDNNIIIKQDTVDGGVDPNAIEVNPEGNVLPGQKLRYTIHFTNTGNDTTYNIYVMDTLSDYLDVSTFKMVMASNAMNVVKLESGGHNILKFNFPNINLLDSMHHPFDCHGGLVFDINVRDDAPIGVYIPNRVGIFFDFNPVVLTNTIVNKIDWPTSVSPLSKISSMVIYPNPATNTITVGNVSEPAGYVISNIVGAKMKQGYLLAGSNTIQISELPKGVYYIKVANTEVKRFVKL